MMSSSSSDNLIDLSLDEIIKLNNRQNRQKVLKKQPPQMENLLQQQNVQSANTYQDKLARQRVQQAKRFLLKQNLNQQNRRRNPNFNRRTPMAKAQPQQVVGIPDLRVWKPNRNHARPMPMIQQNRGRNRQQNDQTSILTVRVRNELANTNQRKNFHGRNRRRQRNGKRRYPFSHF